MAKRKAAAKRVSKAQNKTRETGASVESFLASIADEARRRDCRALLALMRELTGTQPRMWGGSIVGFGSYQYRYESGREGEWFRVGFSPRKQDLTLYLMTGFEEYGDLMQKLGKYRTGRSCLHIKRLSDVDASVLRKLVLQAVRDMEKQYG